MPRRQEHSLRNPCYFNEELTNVFVFSAAEDEQYILRHVLETPTVDYLHIDLSVASPPKLFLKY